MKLWWKGELRESLPAQWLCKDMGMLYGTGLFETCAVISGHIVLLHQHVARLSKSIKALGWQEPKHFENLAKEMQTYLVAVSANQGILRVFYSPGVREAGIWDLEQASIWLQFEELSLESKPLSIECKAHHSSPLMQHKTRSYLAYLNTLQRPLMPLLCEGDQVLELPIANVAFFKANSLVFPTGNCLAGVLQHYLMQLELPFKCEERKIFKAELPGFDEICAMNSCKGIICIETFKGYEYLKSGKKTKQLQQMCRQHLAFD